MPSEYEQAVHELSTALRQLETAEQDVSEAKQRNEQSLVTLQKTAENRRKAVEEAQQKLASVGSGVAKTTDTSPAALRQRFETTAPAPAKPADFDKNPHIQTTPGK